MRDTLLALAAAMLLAAPASAAVTVYTDQAAFLAALEPGAYLETFDTTEIGVTPDPLPYDQAGLGFVVDLLAPAESGLYPYTISGGDPDDVFMSSNSARDTVVFDVVGDGVTALGAYFFAASIAGAVIGSDVIVDTDQTEPMVFSSGGVTTAFLGFASDQPFDFLTMIADSTVDVSFASANDFIVGVAVPEPGGAAAPSAALLALAWCGRRRRRHRQEAG